MKRPRVREGDVRPIVWLPPTEARLWDVKTQGLIETPLDAQGVVDLDGLVEVGKQTVTANYDWTSPFNDIHHLQWPKRSYAIDKVSREFREQVRRKTFIPRRFHNWLHLITLPPPVPDEEVMRYSIAAEKTARALAATAERAVQLTRERGVSDADLAQHLSKAFDEYTLYVENAREVPVEFQLVQLEEIEVRDIEGMLAANKHLGRLALDRIPIRDMRINDAA